MNDELKVKPEQQNIFMTENLFNKKTNQEKF
jgi:hypothetical protein